MSRIPVGIIGATGMVGQQLIRLLSDHPWFEVAFVASSQRSAGQVYREAVAGRWWARTPLPKNEAELMVHSIDAIDRAKQCCRVVFSAVGSQVAAEYEPLYAAAGIGVISCASQHRCDPDVPVLIPEINAEHLKLIPHQQRARGWTSGFLVTKPNCSLQSYLIPLYPIHQLYAVTDLIVTTLQAVSGAGYPGPSALEMVDNVLPFIDGEEEKSEQEPLKILGTLSAGIIMPYKGLRVAAHCNRVPVTDGHLVCASFRCARKPSKEEILNAWRGFRGVPQQLKLPSAPEPPIQVLTQADRPQTRLDRDQGGGMTVSVGRLRDCTVLDYRFVGLSHNAIRGAAGGAILIAELLHQYRLISGV